MHPSYATKVGHRWTFSLICICIHIKKLTSPQNQLISKGHVHPFQFLFQHPFCTKIFDFMIITLNAIHNELLREMQIERENECVTENDCVTVNLIDNLLWFAFIIIWCSSSWQIWQYNDIHFHLTFYFLRSKWEAKSESQTQRAPCDPASWTRVCLRASLVVWKALWFFPSVFCVYWRCPSVNVQSGVWNESERISRGFRNQMNKTWAGAVCSTPFDYYEERCLCGNVCVFERKCMQISSSPPHSPSIFPCNHVIRAEERIAGE